MNFTATPLILIKALIIQSYYHKFLWISSNSNFSWIYILWTKTIYDRKNWFKLIRYLIYMCKKTTARFFLYSDFDVTRTNSYLIWKTLTDEFSIMLNRQISTWLCRRALLHLTTCYMQFPYFQSKLKRNNSGHTISDWQRGFDNKKETEPRTVVEKDDFEMLYLSSAFMPYIHFRDGAEKRHKIKNFPFSLLSRFYLALSRLSTFYIPCFLPSR